VKIAELEKFYCGKRVFLSGHTGFKGSWLALWLAKMGAKICGFSLPPEKESLFNILELASHLEKSVFGDIRNSEILEKTLQDFQPEIIIHLAAQSLVRPSYFDPKTTYETNLIGTLNMFEAARKAGSVKAFLNITTDKCYENREINHAYQEDDALGGYDPYSASKACAEILTSSYRRSFFTKAGIGLASARAGNVIGGGDFSLDRIIPDIFRAIRDGGAVSLRAPNSIRPWQHVLEPLHGYLILAKKLFEEGEKFSKAYNFGPDFDAEANVETLASAFIEKIGIGSYKHSATMEGVKNLHEAGILKLNNSRAKKELNWQPKLSFENSLELVAKWYKNYLRKDSDIKKITINQIERFVS
jgi:CDP-glucose 4,6-dehydratase